MPSPIPTTSRGKNIDRMIKMRVSSTMASNKPVPKKKTTSKTKPSMIAMPSPKKQPSTPWLKLPSIRVNLTKTLLLWPFIPPNPPTYQTWMYPRKRNRRKMILLQRWALVATQSASYFLMKILMIAMSPILPNPLTYQTWKYSRKRNRRKMTLLHHWALVATQSARTIFMKTLMIAMSLILRLRKLMSQRMYAIGHKQSYASIHNFHQWNVSILIVNYLFSTSVKLPGSKGKDIRKPSHVTAACTTHSTNTNMLLIGLGFRRSSRPCLQTKVRNCQLIWMQPLPSRIWMLPNLFLMAKTSRSEMCQHLSLLVCKTWLSVISTKVGRISK